MKKSFFILLALCTNINAYTQTLITYGKNTVKKDEFLRAYNKNNTSVTDKEKSIRDYIELYTNFKLKVKEAQELRLDTSEQIQADLLNFRQQIENNYLEDTQTMKMLQEQAFERSQTDLHVLHFFLPVTEGALPKDTLNALLLTKNLFALLNNGNENYHEFVQANNIKQSDLGFITAFTIPYQYENIVYSLKPGQASEPYRTKKGWHIFKVTESRKSAGKWKVAQILFSLPPNADNQYISEIKAKADSVYELINKGTDFRALAMAVSEDKLTYLNGGEMAEFGTGKYEPSFEKELLQLKKDNDVSKPFITSFGIHIIKRLSVTPTPSDKKEEVYQTEIRQKISADDRISISKEKFAETAIKKTALKTLPSVKQSELFRYADSARSNPAFLSNNDPISKKPIIQFKKENIKVADWLNYVSNYNSDFGNNKQESNAVLWKNFQSSSAIDYYKKNLEEYDSEFNYQLMEFREGNMLFDIMEKKVWGRAASDTAGLKNYYEANKQKYLWANSADVITVTAFSELLVREAMGSMKAGVDWRALTEIKQGELQADSGRFEIAQINEGKINPVPGTYSEIINNEDGSFTFYKFLQKYEAGEQRNFEDAKGLVINDYQGMLEKEWIAELRRKYPVKINETLLKELLK